MEHLHQTVASNRLFLDGPDELTLSGAGLSITSLIRSAEKNPPNVGLHNDAAKVMADNHQFLQNKLKAGTIIYGVNTGYGGSADVRSGDVLEIQRSLVRHLNAGFGDTLPADVVRAVMIVRANSLSKAYSGVRPQVVQCLLEMVNKGVIPVVPKRGSISASGDLIPTSYIAACMMGREDAKVEYLGRVITAPEAFKMADINHMVFQAKEALAVVNSASVASSMAAFNLYDGNNAIVLTQIAVAMSVESLRGRAESFHPTIQHCLPHPGQRDCACAIRSLLKDSKLCLHELEINMPDCVGRLKQDRYGLRSSPQWLGPALETALEAVRRISTEINSANDNPLIDHREGIVLHGANFQGISVTVAMDQFRQALQICGKLLFAQMSEILNYKYSEGLPPNLNGSDLDTDFGFKGTDTAMASYCSELDYLANNMTNHVLSAEMHNQAVNSMGLVSARMTSQASEILQMMLANIFCAQAQAVDLRWLQTQIEEEFHAICRQYKLNEEAISPLLWPWYNMVFKAKTTAGDFYDQFVKNTLPREVFVAKTAQTMERHLEKLNCGLAVDDVSNLLGNGSRKLYQWLRTTLKVPFYNGKQPLDRSLETIYGAIRDRAACAKLILDIFGQEED